MTTVNGWRKVPFGEMARSVTDRVDDPSTAGVDRYVGLEHLDPNSLRIARWGVPSDVEATKLRFIVGDVIFGRRRAYQRKLAVADFDGICSAHALVLRAKPDTVAPGFLPVFMQSEQFFERALAISVGSLSPTINWRQLAKQEFSLPPLDQQRRIADLLWALEEVLDKLVTLDREMRNLEAAFIKEEVCSAAHPRDPLGSVLTSITPGKSLIGSDKPAGPAEHGVLKISAVGPRGFDPVENKCLLDQGAFRSEFRVAAGDFLVTRCNTRELVGRACVVPRDHGNLMLSDKTLRFGLAPNRIDAAFLLAALRSGELRTQIESRATGTGGAMKNLSQPDFQSLRIPLPDFDRQRSLALIIGTHARARSALEAQILVSQRLRHAISTKVLLDPGVKK